MNALFCKGAASNCTAATHAVNRQLCLCITAALLTYVSKSAHIMEFVQNLSQLAGYSQGLNFSNIFFDFILFL